MRKLRLREVVEVTQRVHGELGYRCSQNLCFLICKMGISHCAYLLGCSEDERAVCLPSTEGAGQGVNPTRGCYLVRVAGSTWEKRTCLSHATVVSRSHAEMATPENCIKSK